MSYQRGVEIIRFIASVLIVSTSIFAYMAFLDGDVFWLCVHSCTTIINIHTINL